MFADIQPNIPFIDNSSVLTVGIVIQVFAVAALTWKVAQLNTELQIRLNRLEYDIKNIADKVRENSSNQERQKKALNKLIQLQSAEHDEKMDTV